ncbi:MAG: TniQ family protein [Methylophaga sp.]|nr:TniQ family protein [Methylophaga sp.]
MINNNLPFIPTALPNESPLSLLRRIAIGNGYSKVLPLLHSLIPILDHSNGMLGYVARSPSIYQRLCGMVGISEKSVLQVSYQRLGTGREDHLIWLGLKVAISDLQFHTEKICIQCYLEKNYAYAIWDHFAALGCEYHHIFLDSHCPICKTSWSYDQAPLTCGCDSTDILSRVRPMQKSRAVMLADIIATKNQDQILMLSNLRKLFKWWKKLGIHLSQFDRSDFLYHLLHGNWPALNDKAVTVHPRIILLPLLAATDKGTQILVNKLLEGKASIFSSINIEPVFINRKHTQCLFRISRVRLDRFIKESLVIKNENGNFSLKQINHLLLTSKWVPFGSDEENLLKESNPVTPRPSLAYIIKKELSSSGKPVRPYEARVNDVLTVNDATHVLQANYESIRHLIKIGLIKASKGSKISAVQWAIKKDEINAFDKQYVFASAIAREVHLPVTTTSSRLQSLGISPVSGPGIDKGKTYLFFRSDIESINLSTLKDKPYKSPAGRKRNCTKSKTTISSHELAEKLQIDMYQIRFVVRDRWLPAAKNSQGNYLFKKHDVNCLLRKIDSGYINIETASKITDQSLSSFRKTWITSGFVPEYKLGNQRLITKSDINNIQHLWVHNKTSVYIAKEIGRNRSFCINLEKIGILKPTLVIGEKANKIKLYPTNHPIYRCYMK